MRLRGLVAFFVCFACFTAPFVRAAEREFVRVWPGWRDAETFDTISEYFTGREDAGRRVILRSQPDARAGFYYLVRVAESAESHPSSKFALHVFLPGTPDPKTFTFPTDVPARSTLFQIGLTGADWPGPEIHPVAWKLELLDAQGEVLASAQSFLWSKPPAK